MGIVFVILLIATGLFVLKHVYDAFMEDDGGCLFAAASFGGGCIVVLFIILLIVGSVYFMIKCLL